MHPQTRNRSPQHTIAARTHSTHTPTTVTAQSTETSIAKPHRTPHSHSTHLMHQHNHSKRGKRTHEHVIDPKRTPGANEHSTLTPTSTTNKHPQSEPMAPPNCTHKPTTFDQPTNKATADAHCTKTTTTEANSTHVVTALALRTQQIPITPTHSTHTCNTNHRHLNPQQLPTATQTTEHAHQQQPPSQSATIPTVSRERHLHA